MKKRSLFAAVAMLIVSAIVLTSATYAWFASNSTATVGTISASVAKSDGSILVSGYEDKDYTASLSQATLAAVVNSSDAAVNYFPAYLIPVSFNKANESFKKVTMTGPRFDSVGLNDKATQGSEYVSFTFYVKSTVTCKADMTFTLANNQNFVYAYAAVGSENHVLGTTSASYYPVTSAAGSCAFDDNSNFIVDTSTYDTIKDMTGSSPVEGFDALGKAAVVDDPETDENEAEAAVPAITLGNKVTSEGLTYTVEDVDLVADTPVAVTVYMWAEGQDMNCTGKQTASPTLNITVAKAE